MIEETVDNVKKMFGNKSLFLICGAGAVIVLLLASKSGKNTEEDTQLVASNGVTSYPDVLANANTVIDSINQNSNNKLAQLANMNESYFTEMEKTIGDQTQKIEDYNNELKNRNSEMSTAIIASNMDLASKINDVSTLVQSKTNNVINNVTSQSNVDSMFQQVTAQGSASNAIKATTGSNVGTASKGAVIGNVPVVKNTVNTNTTSTDTKTANVSTGAIVGNTSNVSTGTIIGNTSNVSTGAIIGNTSVVKTTIKKSSSTPTLASKVTSNTSSTSLPIVTSIPKVATGLLTSKISLKLTGDKTQPVTKVKK